jgi:hypothetical protein
VLAGIDLPLVRSLADVGPVVQQLVDVALVQRPAGLAGSALGPEAGHRLDARPGLGEDLEHAADAWGLLLVHDQLARHDVVAERHLAPHPHAAGAGGCEFVADSLANDLPLELRKAEQNVERQPSHAGGRVEALRHGHEGHAMRVHHLDQLREVHQRAAEAIDLVDDDHVDHPCLDVGQQPLQRRPLQRAAGEAAVVVAVTDQHPAFGALAGDVRLAGVALRVEGVELLVQALVGALPRVDRAAKLLDGRRHGRLVADAAAHAPALAFSPKKVQPFHLVPVMWRAMEESD